MLLIYLRSLCFWLPRCRGCWRRDLFQEGLCFSCFVVLEKRRMWGQLADKACDVAAAWIESRLTSRYVSRRGRNPRRTIADAETRELRKIAGLVDEGGVEKSQSERVEKPGEAEEK